MSLEASVKQILLAASRVYDISGETPFEHAAGLSKLLGNNLYLKREDCQPIHSFKIRGAYNKIVQLSDEEKKLGVVTASAGNHAQGVAIVAQHLGIDAYVFMGCNTPKVKIDAVKSFGAKIFLKGNTLAEAFEYALEFSKEKGSILVHPYDDAQVVAGQGTAGVEILKQFSSVNPLNAVFMPVGGGGLLTGIGSYIKHLNKDVKIIAVEAEGTDSLRRALEAGKPVPVPANELDLFADGVAVSQVGQICFDAAKDIVDELIVASTDEICGAVKDIYEETRSITEPSGALALAGMKKYIDKHNCKDQHFVAVVTGANVSFERLQHIAERAVVGEKKEALFAVHLSEQKGSFRDFCKRLGESSISEFNYRVASCASKVASVYVGIGVEDEAHRKSLFKSLCDDGYAALDLTDNEVAKLHIRHMVGGGLPKGVSELVYRFEFPQRPGALMGFLSEIGEHWNITMFHYRNHGAAWGRVLAGFQLNEGESAQQLEALFEKLKYRFWSESDNEAYKIFLGQSEGA